MKNVLLVTIPHSGTNFFHNMFLEAGYHSANLGLNADDLRHAENKITRMHIAPDAIAVARMYARQGWVIATTQRSWEGLKESWQGRRRTLDDLYRDYGMWSVFCLETSPYSLTFEKSFRRDAWVKALADVTGAPLAPQWDKPRNVGKWRNK